MTGCMDRVDLHKYSGGSVGRSSTARPSSRAISTRRATSMNGKVIHNVEDVKLHDLTSDAPYVTYREGDEIIRIDCDYVIGADGFHGVSRKSIPKDVLTRVRAGLSVRLAGRAVAHQAGLAGTDLRQARARLCAVFAAVAGAEPLLHPGAADRYGRGLVGRCLLGGAEAPPAGRTSPRPSGDRSLDREDRSRRCAASSPSRCATATCSSPAMPPTSCRRPARGV